MKASPLSEALCKEIDLGERITIDQDPVVRAKYMHAAHGFDLSEAKKIWCFGPNHFDANVLVDVTRGVAGAADVREAICAGFQWAASEGPLCGEALRGVRFDLVDLQFHADAAHRKGSQMLPAVRRAMMGAMLSGGAARLLEPVYLVEVECAAQAVVGAVYTLLSRKRGEVIEESGVEGTGLVRLRAFMPVNESTGFMDELRGVTGGRAFQNSVFDHWQVLPGDPYEAESRAAQVCQSVRRAKGLREQMPMLADFIDRL
jgi:elongation factor 2